MARLSIVKPRLSHGPRRLKVAPKVADAHYATAEHKAWAAEVKRRAQWRCQAEGCGVHYPARIFADHIVEIRDGGAPFDPANGQALCSTHHQLKTAASRAARR